MFGNFTLPYFPKQTQTICSKNHHSIRNASYHSRYSELQDNFRNNLSGKKDQGPRAVLLALPSDITHYVLLIEASTHSSLHSISSTGGRPAGSIQDPLKDHQ